MNQSTTAPVRIPSRKFRVTIFDAKSCILEELSISAPNLFAARSAVAKEYPDIPSWRIYCMEVVQ